jgi:hypothetical protein
METAISGKKNPRPKFAISGKSGQQGHPRGTIGEKSSTSLEVPDPFLGASGSAVLKS